MIYLGNAFSLGMCDIAERFALDVRPVSADEVSTWLKKLGFTSTVGHADTAALLTSILGVKVELNRASLSLTPEDVLFVAQLTGARLPEGSTTLPEGAKLRFFLVKLRTGDDARFANDLSHDEALDLFQLTSW